MNQEQLASITSWSFQPVAEKAMLAYAPIGHGTGGEMVSYFIAEQGDGEFYLTDNYGATMHVGAHGGRLTPGRLATAGKVASRGFATIRPDGEIIATGPTHSLHDALWDALRISLAVSGNQQSWQPYSRAEYFSARVHEALNRAGGAGRIRQKVKLAGASGHQMEFPFGVIITPTLVRAVQPISAGENGRVDWGGVYQSYGKLQDLKKASADDADNRVAVLDGSMDSDDLAKASTVLTEVSRVVVFRRSDDAFHLVAA